jgi:mannosyltransferase
MERIKSVKNEPILLATLFISLFLRFYDLDKESLWLDEVSSVKLAHLSLSKLLKIIHRDVHPPSLYIFLHFWVKLFGDSEFSLRFPSVIFGFFAILMIYKVGTLIYDKEVGVLSSLILGLSSLHIAYSQEARMYSLFSLLALLSFYFFIKLKERSLRVSIGYILSSILLMYTHVYGLSIIIAQNIYMLMLLLLYKESYRLGFKKWILPQVVLLILFIPWIGILIKQVMHVHSDFWLSEPLFKTLIESFRLYSGSYLFLPFLLLSFFSVITIEKNDVNNWKSFFKSVETCSWNIRLSSSIYLLFVWLLTPIILPFIISKVFTPIYLTKYTIGASLAFYLLIAKGIRNINYSYFKAVIITLIIGLSLVNVWRHYTIVTKEQWRDVANYIDTSAEYNNLLVFSVAYGQNPFDYYSKRSDLIKKPFPRLRLTEIDGEKIRLLMQDIKIDKENIKELIPTVENHNRVWVIVSHCSIEGKEMIVETLRNSYNQLDYKKYVGIEIYLLEKR